MVASSTCVFCGGRDATEQCDEGRPICVPCGAPVRLRRRPTAPRTASLGPSLADRVRALSKQHDSLTVALAREKLPDAAYKVLAATFRDLLRRDELLVEQRQTGRGRGGITNVYRRNAARGDSRRAA